MSETPVPDLYQRFGLSAEAAPIPPAEPPQPTPVPDPPAPAEPIPVPPASPEPLPPAAGEQLPSAGEEQLVGAIRELETMLRRIEQLKRSARTAEDWRALCLYIASVKPRLSELSARAKRTYARSFGDAFDRHYAQGRSEQGRGTTIKAIETRAKRDAALAYEVSERLERTWRDLQDLLWSCKAVADDLAQGERGDSFDALPEHLFGRAGS